MRNPLYKAISTETREWVRGLPVYRYQTEEIDALETPTDMLSIDRETLCEFVGKKDKNSKEIFEGDKIQFIHRIGNQTIKEIVTVYFSEASASFVLGVEGCLLPFGMYDVSKGEVIGNIYDVKLSILHRMHEEEIQNATHF